MALCVEINMTVTFLFIGYLVALIDRYNCPADSSVTTKVIADGAHIQKEKHVFINQLRKLDMYFKYARLSPGQSEFTICFISKAT